MKLIDRILLGIVLVLVFSVSVMAISGQSPRMNTIYASTPQSIQPLPENIFRPASALPPAAVKAFTEAEGGTLTPAAERTLRIADWRFRQLDVANKGNLGPDAFQMFYLSSFINEDIGQPIEVVRKTFATHYLAQLDIDKDGILTAVEADKRWDVLYTLDENGDRKLNVSELTKLPELVASRDFQVADTNQDDIVDLTEFVLWWRTLHAPVIFSE